MCMGRILREEYLIMGKSQRQGCALVSIASQKLFPVAATIDAAVQNNADASAPEKQGSKVSEFQTKQSAVNREKSPV